MSIFKIFSEETQSLWKFYFVFIKSFAVFEIFDELSILWSIECLMDKIWPFLSTSVRRRKLKKGDFHKILNFKRQVALLICPRHESSYLVHSIARGIFLSETESRTEMKTQTIAIENHTKLMAKAILLLSQMVLTFQKVGNAFEKFERHLVDPVLVAKNCILWVPLQKN